MNVFDLAAKITLDSSGYEKTLAMLQTSMNSISKRVDSFAGGFQTISSGFSTAATKAAVAGQAIYDAMKHASEAVLDLARDVAQVGIAFDSSMSNVAAISGATAEEVALLRDKAKEMGAATVFTASEAADAFSYMAMAGWKTEDMLAGIEGIMNLAASSGEDLASTSDIVTDALTAFGLTAADSGRFADVLAAASSNSNTNVAMMGETFKYVAPLAGTMGYTIEDMAVAIGLMANSGVKGSQAGTTLRQAISSIVNPTDKAAEAMGLLGLMVSENSDGTGGYNAAVLSADGTMLSFTETVEKLREVFSALSKEQQTATAALLFGQEAMSGMLSLINASPADIDKLTAAVTDASGAAEGMANTMIDNVGGALKLLESAAEGLSIEMYELFSDDLQGLILGLADAFSRLTQATSEGGLDGFFSELGEIIFELTGINLEPVVEKLQTFSTEISGVFSALKEAYQEDSLSGVFSELITQIEEITQIDLSAVETVFLGIADAVKRLFEAGAEGGPSGVVDAVVQMVENFTGVDITPVVTAIGGIADAVKRLFETGEGSNPSEIIAPIVQMVKDFTGVDISPVIEGLSGLATSISNLVTNDIGPIVEDIKALFDVFKNGGALDLVLEGAGAFLKLAGALAQLASGSLEIVIGNIRDLTNQFQDLPALLVGAGTAIGTFLLILNGATIITTVVSAVKGLQTAMLALNAAIAANPIGLLISLVAGLVAALVTAYQTNDKFREKVDAAFSAIAEAVPKAVQAVKDKIGEFVQAGKDLISGLANGFMDGVTSFINSAKEVAQKAVDAVKGFFGIKSPSRVFAEIGRFLMAGLSVGLEDSTPGVLKTIRASMDSITDAAQLQGTVDFASSAVGKSSAGVVNGMFASSQAGDGRTYTINLVMDGRTTAQVLFDPLNNVAKQKGVALSLA